MGLPHTHGSICDQETPKIFTQRRKECEQMNTLNLLRHRAKRGLKAHGSSCENPLARRIVVLSHCSDLFPFEKPEEEKLSYGKRQSKEAQRVESRSAPQHYPPCWAISGSIFSLCFDSKHSSSAGTTHWIIHLNSVHEVPFSGCTQCQITLFPQGLSGLLFPLANSQADIFLCDNTVCWFIPWLVFQ